MRQQFISILIFLFITSTAFAQSWEGEIIYKNTYKSKVEAFSDAQWGSIVGMQNEYYIKGGNYKSMMNGSVVASYTYLAKDNKLYTEFQDGDLMYWSDAAQNKDTVISFEVKKNAARILNYNCDEVTIYTKKGTQVYDYAPALAVDPMLFANHKFGNWFYYLSIAKAMPLRMELEQDQVVITSEAISVKPMKLTDEFFLLPADDKLMKSPY